MEVQKQQWEEDKNRLEQEVQERDALLEKADSHLSHESIVIVHFPTQKGPSMGLIIWLID
jgi:hypothetical protein